MRRLLVAVTLIGAGVIGFSAASQAGMSIRPMPLAQSGAAERNVAGPECRVEKTLKFDFNGNPYVKKVRVCA